MSGPTRRGLLGGSLAAGVAGAAGGAFALGRSGAEAAGRSDARVVAFRGVHQAGVLTPPQDRIHFVALDVVTDDRAELVDLLRRWTVAAERLTRGRPAGPVGPVGGDPDLPPDDTGEALDIGPSRLSITFGVGPGLFRDAAGRDRFGLAARRPAALEDLPRFRGDALDPRRSGGDLCLQVCADDPQVAVHAVRNLVRLGFGVTRVRWSQLGFGRPASAEHGAPRNLFGFKDGTANPAVDEHLWVRGDDDPAAAWLAGGTYLVARRIAMAIEVWDRQPLADQEAFVGRTKGEGGPLSGGGERAEPDFARRGPHGPLIPADAHVRVVHPTRHGGARMLRRGYHFVDGTTDVGGLDAGLFFVAFVRDPRTHFVPAQRAMAASDALMEYLTPTGSALFAVPPGVGPGGTWAEALFA